MNPLVCQETGPGGQLDLQDRSRDVESDWDHQNDGSGVAYIRLGNEETELQTYHIGSATLSGHVRERTF